MSPIRVSVDIETLGTDPRTAPLVSIGACTFTIDGTVSNKFHVVLDWPQQVKEGWRVVAADTLAWWMQQSDAARKLFTRNDVDADGLNKFGQWITALKTTSPGRNLEMWANPPSFDLGILRSHFEEKGLPVPWEWRTERDLRTLRNVLNVSEPEFVGVPHDALDDAINQASCVACYLRKIGVQE